MFIRSVRVDPIREDTYIRDIPVVRHLSHRDPLRLASPVTCFVGDNGSGKSTLVEAIAIAAGFDPGGGPLRHADFQGRIHPTHSPLARWLSLRGRAIPERGYFLRAETHYDTVTIFDTLPDATETRHAMSHGESVLSILADHVHGAGLYIFDEPESGLSVVRQMALAAEIHQAVQRGAQFIIATHSPIMLAIPDAAIIDITEDGLEDTVYEEAEAVIATREFLEDPQGTIRYILG
ncbi:Predicted ATPase [Corynebacterium pollutisoli]|uniref:Predicted ATPase n=1 Tax=Corynebacterium pollutisoli TaxID=1610489 RepID=A0A1X7I1R5_9CORY|nr:AAA family ATPase [Corynebacterium pollutisoli]SMG08342.1 Predicted ATPase [Corynebacterium pollutisoli]